LSNYFDLLLYGAETWSITKAIEKRIDAFDQWCLRRILNITWSDCATNFEVRRRTGQPLLSDTVRIRRLKLFGHVARANKSQDHSRALQAWPRIRASDTHRNSNVTDKLRLMMILYQHTSCIILHSVQLLIQTVLYSVWLLSVI